MPRIEVSKTIAAAKKEVYEIIKNMERFPEFMSDVKQVKVIKKQDDKIVTEWKADIDGVPLEWIEEDIFNDKEMSCAFKAIEGDYGYKGRWKLEEANNGKTEVSVMAEFDWEVPHFEKFIGHILEKKARSSLRSMLSAITKKLSNG